MRRYARNDYFGADMKTTILTFTLAAMALPSVAQAAEPKLEGSFTVGQFIPALKAMTRYATLSLSLSPNHPVPLITETYILWSQIGAQARPKNSPVF